MNHHPQTTPNAPTPHLDEPKATKEELETLRSTLSELTGPVPLSPDALRTMTLAGVENPEQLNGLPAQATQKVLQEVFAQDPSIQFVLNRRTFRHFHRLMHTDKLHDFTIGLNVVLQTDASGQIVGKILAHIQPED
ncbi:MAG: hypothetical protein AAGF53_17850 [Pseudomonadota bacterium]